MSLLLASALVFTGLYFLFRKYTSNKNPVNNPYYWITAVVATPVVYIGLILIWFLVSSSFEAKNFDKVRWEENREYRYEYVDDLVDNKKLIGLSVIELKHMLGEADYEDDSTLSFYIGYTPKYFLNMDPDWLEINLTEKKATDVRIRK